MQDQDTGFVKITHDEFNGDIKSSHHGELTFGGNVITIRNRLTNTRDEKKDYLFLKYIIFMDKVWGLQEIELFIDGDCQRFSYTMLNEEILPYADNFAYKQKGYTVLNSSVLKRIGDAVTLKVRYVSSTGNIKLDEKWCADFQLHCQQFYNNVYDDSCFVDSVSGISPKAEEKEREYRVAKRDAVWRELSFKRNCWLFATLFVPVVIYLMGVLTVKYADDLPIWFWVFEGVVFVGLGALFLIPQLKIEAIINEVNNECPKCHNQTIIFGGTSKSFYGVRSKEDIVTNRLTGAYESKQVTVSDYEVTNSYGCSHCHHHWSHSYIEQG